MISGDEKKRAENEATFREANEQIRAVQRSLDPPVERVPYICECDDVSCRETIPLAAHEYERVREDGATFAIAPGHPSEGDVIDEYEDYVVVRKSHDGGRRRPPPRPATGWRMSDEQARRVGLNESLFREVNEQIQSLNRDFHTDFPTMTVICECASGDCTEQVEISVDTYESVRADPRRYIIVPGHEMPEFESVVESGDGYDVVQKRDGTAAALAEQTDPRS